MNFQTLVSTGLMIATKCQLCVQQCFVPVISVFLSGNYTFHFSIVTTHVLSMCALQSLSDLFWVFLFLFILCLRPRSGCCSTIKTEIFFFLRNESKCSSYYKGTMIRIREKQSVGRTQRLIWL